MPQLFVVHLSGPPCSGKSTLENALTERLPGAYIVSFDRMKWQLAGYDRAKDGSLIDGLVLGLFEVACKKKIPVILDFSFRDEEEYLACRQIAEKNGHRFVSIALTAPVKVLLERFHNRIKEAKRTGAKVTITDDSEFLETVAKKFFVPTSTFLFDTSVATIEDITKNLIESLSRVGS